MDDIPQWAVERACAIFNAAPKDADCGTWHLGDAHDTATGIPQFAAYIAAHEEPPVDPLLIEARQLIANCNLFRSNNQMQAILDGHAGTLQVNIALTALRRGIEIERERQS